MAKVLYHVASERGADELLKRGVVEWRKRHPSMLQGGQGFYCAPDREFAEFWNQRLYGGRGVILTVSLPQTARIAPLDLVERTSQDKALIRWAALHGYIQPTQDGTEHEVTRKLLDAHGASAAPREEYYLESGALWTMLGLYLKERGYDGYASSSNTVVVTNRALLKASAFNSAR